MKSILQAMIKTSNLLILVSILLILALIISGVMDAKRVNSPFKVFAESDQTNMDLSPIILFEDDPSHPLFAPEISSINDFKERIQVSLTPVASHEITGVSGIMPQVIAPLPALNPDWISIPAIKLDAPIVNAELRNIDYGGQTFRQWSAPNIYTAGLLSTSAPLGVTGNTVLIGHNNFYGEVFEHLVDLQIGDQILLYSREKEFTYIIALKMILRERSQSIDVRIKNSEWMAPSTDERVTLITCWPYQSNTHRLIIVAVPVDLIENMKTIPN